MKTELKLNWTERKSKEVIVSNIFPKTDYKNEKKEVGKNEIGERWKKRGEVVGKRDWKKYIEDKRRINEVK